MFAMYDDDGLNFRNNIDHLYKVQEAAPAQRLKNRLDKDGSNKQSFEENLYQGQATKEATNAYKEVTNLEVKNDIYHVDQIMSHKVFTISDENTIRECYDMMLEHVVHQLPIIAENKLHLKGIITRNDVLKYVTDDLENAEEKFNQPISNISTKKIITTDPMSDIRRVAQVLIDLNINALPVVDSNDILVGMVTRNDIVKAVASLPHLQLWA